jgi:Fic family protein
MKKSDLSAERQAMLVPIEGSSGVFGLIPPPMPYQITMTGLLESLSLAQKSLADLSLIASKIPNPNMISRTLDRREAVRSSQIEGTRSSFDDLLSYEATGNNSGLPADVIETLNYVKALESGLELVDFAKKNNLPFFNHSLFLSVHNSLMQGVLDFKGIPGEYRGVQNWIGGFNIYQASFVPPPPNYVQSCMDDLIEKLNNPFSDECQYEVSIVVRMAIAHAQFESIHPFIDGNGRVGRILPPLMLASENYPPIYLAGYLKSNQQEYYKRLLDVQLKGKWREWIGFFSKGVVAAAKESMSTARDLLFVIQVWKIQIEEGSFRSDSVIHKMPEYLAENPIVTINQVKNYFDVSFPTANKVVNDLISLGVLKSSNKQRDRTFVAESIVSVLNADKHFVSNMLESQISKQCLSKKALLLINERLLEVIDQQRKDKNLDSSYERNVAISSTANKVISSLDLVEKSAKLSTSNGC